MEKIPFVDLKTQYDSIKTELDSAINSVIEKTSFIQGEFVEKFEEEYAEIYGVKHCIGCANGTDAIYITLKSYGIGHGDEVITVANTWISTAETITQTGAKPIFVDIEPDYYTIDVSKIAEKINDRTKAIIPVHLFGQSADMDTLKDICDQYNLILIEDCAQAHFAEWKGQKVGTFGNAATFSFFPGKNLGAYGDAGGIITDDSDFAKRARMYANHGSLVKHEHEIEGINSRLDGLQAAILSVKLKYIVHWSQMRFKNAKKYDDFFAGNDKIITPKVRDFNNAHVFHLYVIRTENREKLIKILSENGVSTGIHYPTPLPFLKAYKHLLHTPDQFPVAHKYQNKILSLPMFPELNDEQIERIAKIINNISI